MKRLTSHVVTADCADPFHSERSNYLSLLELTCLREMGLSYGVWLTNTRLYIRLWNSFLTKEEQQCTHEYRVYYGVWLQTLPSCGFLEQLVCVYCIHVSLQMHTCWSQDMKLDWISSSITLCLVNMRQSLTEQGKHPWLGWLAKYIYLHLTLDMWSNVTMLSFCTSVTDLNSDLMFAEKILLTYEVISWAPEMPSWQGRILWRSWRRYRNRKGINLHDAVYRNQQCAMHTGTCVIMHIP